ncbi:hypothetical protein NDU88_005980 [Pleurodeles waltl]|uniref:DDE Tnp4 domain-containing protein n=1 Tax=Pleurodeles waltl TaxID=8319 RepID=A0AAV7LYV4_PLEWA|nr:hypothetical protein NDU88_005980 [Pleurodeles waltl]
MPSLDSHPATSASQTHSRSSRRQNKGFYLIKEFPHVLGAIDCTHVRLVPPAATEHLYCNKKQTHSINVQAIVDHQGLITNIVAKYPGSVHDSFIFRYCTINQHFQDGRYGNGLLVGGRVIQGYHTEARRLRLGKVLHHLQRVYRTPRNDHQLKHRWADLISREQDLMDHLGIVIGGPVGEYQSCKCARFNAL